MLHRASELVRPCECIVLYFWVPLKAGISWLAEWLLASEGLCSMQSVSSLDWRLFFTYPTKFCAYLKIQADKFCNSLSNTKIVISELLKSVLWRAVSKCFLQETASMSYEWLNVRGGGGGQTYRFGVPVGLHFFILLWADQLDPAREISGSNLCRITSYSEWNFALFSSASLDRYFHSCSKSLLVTLHYHLLISLQSV
jgi:hypothetical protein